MIESSYFVMKKPTTPRTTTVQTSSQSWSPPRNEHAPPSARTMMIGTMSSVSIVVIGLARVTNDNPTPRINTLLSRCTGAPVGRVAIAPELRDGTPYQVS